MKLKIEEEEKMDALASIASNALQLLDSTTGNKYIVIHNDDGTCLKAGVNEKDGLWVAKYTEDDPQVK